MYHSTKPNDVTLKTKKVTNETLASTRRMLGLVHESQDAGAQTLQMLHAQGDQLNRVERGLDNIHEDLDLSGKHLSNIEAVENCSCCVFCQRQSKRKKHRKLEQDALKFQQVDPTKKVTKNNFDRCNTNANPRNRASDRGGKLHGNGGDEIENNLEDIEVHVQSLKHQAIDMGQVVQTHNKQIDRLNIKSEAGNIKIDSVTSRTNNLIKGPGKPSRFSLWKCCGLCAIL